jgi:hypothetical protein
MFSVVLAAEKWFALDSAGRYLHKAPSLENIPNPAHVANLRREWIYVKSSQRPTFVAEKLDAYAPSLFSLKEIEEAVVYAEATFIEDATFTMQYRVLAARILKKLPRPFAREVSF